MHSHKCQELEDDKHEGQDDRVGLDSDHECQDHHDQEDHGRDDAPVGEHVLELAHRAHKERSTADWARQKKLGVKKTWSAAHATGT